jgi:two-component system chemotaxis response regulator CheY
MKALVVDDSKAMRMVLSRMLTALGFDVTQAPDGPGALATLSANPHPDVLLIDWHMPKMEGIDVVSAARAAPYDYTGRIMMVTTETEAEQVMRALAAGADEYIMKPFTQEGMADKLALLGLDSESD